MRTILMLCVTALIAGCGGVELSTPEETRLSGDYHFLWDYDSIPPKLNIGRRTSESGYSILITDVLSYGWTNGIIIATCRPAAVSAGGTNSATFAILTAAGDGKGETVIANLTHQDYIKQRMELRVPESLAFTRWSQ
jgi:hypothetical protein